MSLADLMYESRHCARLRRMGWKVGGAEEEECADCGKDITGEKDIFENKDGEPICGYCWEKRLEAAEYFSSPE